MSKTPKFVLREGFWKSKQEPLLPRPVTSEKAWKGKRKFLERLALVESLVGVNDNFNLLHSKGWSNCRVCDKKNGSAEFVAHEFKIDCRWPDGFKHYIDEHNVRPSLAFQDYIQAVEALYYKKK